MKRSLLIVLLFIATISANGQAFTQAIGIRGGITSGFEYRRYVDDLNSYKLLLGVRNEGVQLHALKEFHKYDLFDFAYQIVFYYGFGIHGGFESWEVVEHEFDTRRTRSKSALIAGADVLLGLEYIFDTAPVSAGIEVKPYFDVFGKKDFDLVVYDFAFTIKYLF
ncbi:MAG TPA: hypothetical protein VKA10_05815 [Prolixibacteraceae bacterium]|nr:hypothetical protein [Prolixibacteraceae bacterium]